jgi:hypothetical protein
LISIDSGINAKAVPSKKNPNSGEFDARDVLVVDDNERVFQNERVSEGEIASLNPVVFHFAVEGS